MVFWIKSKSGMFKITVDDDFTRKHAITSVNICELPGGRKYVRCRYENKTQKLHRVVIGAAEGQHVDHINGDTLDNRLSNLRICTHSENMRNRVKKAKTSSKYKGVSWCGKDWVANIKSDGVAINLGHYATEEEAAIAYNFAALKYHKQFAKLNRPK